MSKESKNSTVQQSAPVSPDDSFAEEEKTVDFGDVFTEAQKKPQTGATPVPDKASFDDGAISVFDSVPGISLSELGFRHDAFGDGSLVESLNFRNPMNFDAPESRPGYEQRFCNFMKAGKPEPDYVAAMMKDGWQPRLFERGEITGFALRRVADQTFGGKYVVITRNQLLCERPVAVGERFKAMIRNKTALQEQSTKTDLQAKGYNSGVRVEYDNRSAVTVGGRIPPVAPNMNKR